MTNANCTIHRRSGEHVECSTGGDNGVVLISQPVHQHSYETAVAAQEAGLLRCFVNGIYYTGRGVTSSEVLARLPSRLRIRLEDELLRRSHPELDSARVYTISRYHLLATGVRRSTSRVPSLRSLDLEPWAHARFDRAVGRLVPQIPGLRIVHSFEGGGLETMRVARRLGITTVLDVTSAQEDLAALTSSDGQSNLSRIKAEREEADFMFAPSDYAIRCLLENGVPDNKILKVPYGVDQTRFTPGSNPNRGERPFRVLFVGAIGMPKGVRYLLEAWRELALPDAELLLIGDADATGRKILREFQGLYTWPGSLPKHLVHERFKESDVLVLPSLSDSWGLVVTEAMASGLPVVVTEKTGAPVRDGLDGFVGPPRDATALYQRLMLLYHEPLVREAMGLRARERVLSDYTWDHYRTRIAHAYESILSAQDMTPQRRVSEGAYT